MSVVSALSGVFTSPPGKSCSARLQVQFILVIAHSGPALQKKPLVPATAGQGHDPVLRILRSAGSKPAGHYINSQGCHCKKNDNKLVSLKHVHTKNFGSHKSGGRVPSTGAGKASSLASGGLGCVPWLQNEKSELHCHLPMASSPCERAPSFSRTSVPGSWTPPNPRLPHLSHLSSIVSADEWRRSRHRGRKRDVHSVELHFKVCNIIVSQAGEFCR